MVVKGKGAALPLPTLGLTTPENKPVPTGLE